MVMGRIKLRYYTTSGRQETIKIPTTTSVLNLASHDIVSIDLTPLEYCSEMRRISLNDNSLEMIDLNPVCRLQNLTTLNLHENLIEKINLTPLFFSELICNLELDQEVQISADPIVLFSRANTALINFRKNMILNTSYSQIVDKIGWRTLLLNTRELLRLLQPQHWFAAQRGLLHGLGMKEIAAFDGNPYNILSAISDGSSFEEAKLEIYDYVVDYLQKQIQNGGTTHFLDVDELATSPGAILVSDVIEARRKEIESLILEVVEGKTDARNIWFTFYGQQIMKELGYTPFPSNKVKLSQIIDALKEAEIPPQIQCTSTYSKKQPWECYSPGLANHLETIGRGATLVIDEKNPSWIKKSK